MWNLVWTSTHKTLAGLMQRKRERERGGWGGGGVGEKRLNPPEFNVNVHMPLIWVWHKVDRHLSNIREHPSDAELGVFHHFPWQLATEAPG